MVEKTWEKTRFDENGENTIFLIKNVPIETAALKHDFVTYVPSQIM